MFYLQSDLDTGLISPDTAVVAELLNQKAWRNREEPGTNYRLVKWSDAAGGEIDPAPERDAIPVGSLDFCEAVLGKGRTAYPGIRPLNVPSCLRDSSYICRRMKEAKPEEIQGYFKKWNTDKLFIKSMTIPKAYTGLYSRRDKLPEFPDDIYLVSETLEFNAEWRCFVYNNKIMDIRRYSGSYAVPFLPCDVEFAREIVRTVAACVRPRLDAYTLDLGKTTAREVPVVVELHNFLSCGLYGYEDPVILQMLTAAAKREREASA